MGRRILWVVAVLAATAALVAGCVNVDVPKGPYVTMSGSPRSSPPPDPARVRSMDKAALESEVLRLVGENDALRQDNDKLRRDNKTLKSERDRYRDQAESLQDQIKDLRKR